MGISCTRVRRSIIYLWEGNLDSLLQEEIGQLEAEVAEERERCRQQMLAARKRLESQATEVR